MADAGLAERRAAETFDAAIRADGDNVDPKYNLELLFRRIVVVGTREGAGFGSGTLGGSLAGAGAGAPGIGLLRCHSPASPFSRPAGSSSA